MSLTRDGGVGCRYVEGFERIVGQALALSAEDRVAIADSLMDSLNPQVDEDAEQAWRVEIRKRMADSDAGLGQTISWDEVQVRLKNAIR